MSTNDPVAEIKDKIDLAEFVQQYLPLKKAGVNWIGLCPFHDEKTPSFTVSPERQTFKCFGCGKGGDVFSFVMEKEGLSFPETLQLLAAKTGVPLPERGQFKPQQTSLKKTLFDLNESCADFWHQILLKHPKANEARAYLTNKRKISLEQLKTWRLGFAPPPQTTRERLGQHGFTPEQQRQAGEPARFAGRLIFPLADITGRVIGFTGRLLPAAERDINRPVGPKYWNTPETLIFKKSEALYGLHLAKDYIRREGVVIMAEGQTDVIGLHQVGLKNAVASSGTALTEQQLKILARFASEITFAYDADGAGQAAAERGFHLALTHDLNPTVMQLPAGEDPGSLAATKPSVLTRSYASRQPIIQWLLTLAINTHGVAQPAAKKRITKTILPWVARLTDAVERASWLDLISEQIHTPTDALREELAKLKNPARAVTGVRSAVKPKPDQLTLIMGVIGGHPSLIDHCPHLPQLIRDTAWQAIWQHLTAGQPLDRESQNQLAEAIMTAEREYGGTDLTALQPELRQLYERAITEYNQTIKQQLTGAITEAEAAGDQPTVDSLIQQLRSATIQEDDQTTSKKIH